jgi:hypothetical protein
MILWKKYIAAAKAPLPASMAPARVPSSKTVSAPAPIAASTPSSKNKVRKPLSDAALAEAERLRGQNVAGHPAERVVIDLSHYAAVADRLRSVPPPTKEENPE